MSRLPDSTRASDRSPLRILVVDDEPTLRLGFAYALTNATTQAETASNGAEALERLAEKSFDAVVLDLRMPDVDGLAVIEALRRRGDFTPVILCSAYITVHSAVKAIHHHVVDFLMKPVKPVELRSAVKSVIHPGDSWLEKGLASARAGRLDQALDFLDASDQGTLRESSWRRILKIMHEHPGELERIEFELSESVLGQLAHQADNVRT
ncbi:DNA-binding response OmpR family regulator [Haloferula luteola]|uniref:DNA-binding response OmpR family regulator n=1 Tax=Haloferula luteola TaxID=595692 RepID=A0A840UZU1_9BACT|nr:response regulator [Haloferula luteola]MBB5350346.1 DNA-binding response OmpR family regulator [Haloferula luteola]